MDKSTDELMKILRQKPNAENFLKENENELLHHSLTELLQTYLISKNLKKSEVIRDSYLDRTYAYQIFDGKHKPSRDKLLCLAFGLHLTVDETQLLLNSAQLSKLYPRIKRDILIVTCLEKGQKIFTCNEILETNGEPILQ